MDGLVGAGMAGAVAGLGVAMPLGAVGVLLVQRAVVAGWAVAAAGGCGVALVDGLYASAALGAGAGVTAALAGHERAIQVAGAVLLAAIAVKGLLALRAARGVVHDPGFSGASVLGTGARFVGLTLVNPLTAVYFVALAAGGGELLQGPGRSVVFVVGVLASSSIWQLTLVSVSVLVAGRLGGVTRTVTALGGNLLVLGYAVRLGLGS